MATAGYSGARPRGPLAGSTREAAQATAPGFGGALRALLDAGAGALRGSTRATLGLPGDLESLVRLLTGGETVLPTSESLDKALPGIEGHTAQTFDKVGEFVPLPVPPKAAGALAKAGYANLTAPGDMALQSQRGAVRLKGGNFNDARLAGYLGDTLNVHTPEYFDLIGDPAREGRAGAVGDWGRKQLKNYLRKDLGSPTDPLLQVEKEYPNLHLPDEMMDDPWKINNVLQRLDAGETVGGMNGLDRHSRAAKAHRALTDQPMTPWGLYSDSTIYSSSPREYLDELSAGMYDPADGAPEGLEWLTKVPSDTKIWGFSNPHEDDLGFNHVLDYLEAATEPYSEVRDYVGRAAALGGDATEESMLNAIRAQGREAMLPFNTRDAGQWQGLMNAGLDIDPASLPRLSVADAVRKTAQWNELLKNSGVAGDPDLARGIVRTYKEYPEEGMKWVELGESDVVPEGWKQKANGDWIMPDGTTTSTGPARRELSAGLNAEGKAMGHCVGGYCDEVAERGTKIYSLRDKNGNPHVTVEVRPGRLDAAQLDKLREQVFAKIGKGAYMSPSDNLAAMYVDARKDPAVNALSPLEWKSRELGLEYPEVPPEIAQIKGKQNAAPVEKYLPFVQDFVKNGKWGKVGDLKNTGLKSVGGKYFAESELKDAIARTGVNFGKYEQNWDYYDKIYHNFGSQPSFWDEDISPQYAPERALFRELGLTPQPKARGGSIRTHKFLATLRAIREEA